MLKTLNVTKYGTGMQTWFQPVAKAWCATWIKTGSRAKITVRIITWLDTGRIACVNACI